MNDAAREAVAILIRRDDTGPCDADYLQLAERILSKLAELGFVDESRLTSEAAAIAANNACQAYDGSDGGGLYGDIKAAITAAVAVARAEYGPVDAKPLASGETGSAVHKQAYSFQWLPVGDVALGHSHAGYPVFSRDEQWVAFVPEPPDQV